MLKNSQTKVIMPTLALGVLQRYLSNGETVFADSEVRRTYHDAVRFLKAHLGHNIHVGGKYEDAYGMRMSRYGFFQQCGHLRYRIAASYVAHASALCCWLPDRIKAHIEARVGIIPKLADPAIRFRISNSVEEFIELLSRQLDSNPTGFEIASFAIIKVHLERFACKIYRDTRTSAHDHGVDLATNFGVVYQVKKLRIGSVTEARKLYASLKLDFDEARLQDGNVILIIDDVSERAHLDFATTARR
jgi:hypothetical protein